MDTLVLSIAYEPVERICWQRAVTLWWLEKVEVVEEYADRHIGGPGYSMPMPCVVRHTRPARRRKRTIRFSRQNVYARDGGKCMYCARTVPMHEATYDHVIPRRLKGRTCWENIVIACQPCNQKKGGRMPEQAGMRLLTKPVKPRSLPSVARGIAYTSGMPERWKPYLGLGTF